MLPMSLTWKHRLQPLPQVCNPPGHGTHYQAPFPAVLSQTASTLPALQGLLMVKPSLWVTG